MARTAFAVSIGAAIASFVCGQPVSMISENVQRTCQGWGTSGDVHYEKDYSRVTCQRMWGMEPLVSFIKLRFEKSWCSLLQ